MIRFRLVQPVGPYYLLGWSFGGMVAHAVATEFQQRGEQVSFLANIDAYPSWFTRENSSILSEEELLTTLLDMIECDMTSLKGEPVTFAKAVELFHRQGHALASIDEYHLSAITEILTNSVDLAINFTPRVFHGDMLLFTSTIDQPEEMPSPEVWTPYVDGSIEIYQVSSRHDRLMQPGPLGQIGPILAAKLRKIAGNESLSDREG